MSRYHGSKISGSQQQQQWQRERQKKTIDYLEKQNNNFTCDHAFFVHFLAVIARLRHKTS